jgi:altronate dehydratase
MDINAGTIATGEETIEEVGLKLFEFILDVASGPRLPCRTAPLTKQPG